MILNVLFYTTFIMALICAVGASVSMYLWLSPSTVLLWILGVVLNWIIMIIICGNKE